MQFAKGLGVLSLVVALGGLFAGPAGAVPVLSFSNITVNSVADATIGEAQLTVEVSSDGATGMDADATMVFFKFLNAGPADSSITDVYFADGTLLGIATITNGTGVDFEEEANPGNLPGGNSIGFTASFTADSEPPAQPNGVNPGEFLTIAFNLIDGQTYSDTLAALALPAGADGSLLIGIHVQGFEGGGSESFVNQPPNGGGGEQQVPEPGSLLLLGLGLAGLALARRRRSL